MPKLIGYVNLLRNIFSALTVLNAALCPRISASVSHSLPRPLVFPYHHSAIDQGTTSSRFIVFSEAGEIVASHQLALPNYFPQPGWQEQDPREILDSVLGCMAAVAEKINVRMMYRPCRIAMSSCCLLEDSILLSRNVLVHSQLP